ncbi:cyclase [Halobacteriales archaeon SW_6_65_15]|nr:MAG: cyclase [Halobacteriales archaeon SW_6_65_15]
MSTYQREVRVRAPFAAVWKFHSRIEGLEALTPDWMRLRIEEVRGPNGATDADVLEAGTTVRASVRPFGVGPRQRWTSRIVRREAGDGSALFGDVMDDGPFPEWRHTHAFYAISEDETLVRDRVDEPMFRERHRRTKEILEGGGTRNTESAGSRAEDQRSE